jgi:hypothetical protein
MAITVVNKRGYQSNGGISVYIGRPSILGNPYTHLKGKTLAEYTVATRDNAVKCYTKYFIDAIKNNKEFKAELDRIKKLSEENDVYLVCWCAPKRCHGDIIKDYLYSQNF